MSQLALDRLKERFGEAVLSTHSKLGDDTAVVARDRILEIARFLKDDAQLAFNLGADMCGVDYFGREPRFEVVYHLYSIPRKHRLRVKVQVPEEDAIVDSVVSVWAGFNWFEREIWDMYGIRFRGHPDLRRMFMWKSFEGHPLRKDYPKERRQPLARREGITR